MKKVNGKVFMVITSLALMLLIPAIALAADFVPLAPIPTNLGGDTQTIGGYVNTVFQLAIAFGAALAVLRIVIGGFRYMVSEAIPQTKEARSDITAAIVGLLLLLVTWLTLNIISERILNLDALNFSSLGPSQAELDAIQEAQDQAAQNRAARDVDNKIFLKEDDANQAAASCGGTVRKVGGGGGQFSFVRYHIDCP